MADMNIWLGGPFKIFYLAIIVVGGIIGSTLVALSPAATEYADFYASKYWMPLAIGAVEILVLFVTGGPEKGISIFPVGSFDPDTYPLQRFIGYYGALAVAIGAGIVLAIFWYTVVSATSESFLPVPKLLVEGLQAFSSNTRDYLSGTNANANAIVSSVFPTFFENPTFLYSTMLLTWVPIMVFLRYALNIPPLIASGVGMIVWVLSSGVLFAFLAHAFVYEDIEPAYNKAFIFVATCAIPTGLTGFPIPCDMAHLANNYAASLFSVVGVGSVIPVALGYILIFAVPRILVYRAYKKHGVEIEAFRQRLLYKVKRALKENGSLFVRKFKNKEGA